MKKSVPVLVLLFAVQSAWAADMSKKVGFGIGQAVPGGSFLLPSYFTMRVGLLSGVVLAPELYVTTTSNDSKIDSVKTSDQDVGLSLAALIRVIGTTTTNVYGIGALGFRMEKSSVDDYTQNPWKENYSRTEVGLDLGLGLEHFVTNTLSVNLNTLSGFSRYSSKREREQPLGTTTTVDEDTGTFIGLKNIDSRFFVIWYVPFM